MPHNELRFDGMAEFRETLQRLPDELSAEAGVIVTITANATKDEIVAAYPVYTGNLKRGVIVTNFDLGRFLKGKVVKNTAPHAWLFENGSQARHSKIGANRGSMPPGHVFIPAMIRNRRRLQERLKALLVRHGLVASGEES